MGALIAGSINSIPPVMTPKNAFNTKPVDIPLIMRRSTKPEGFLVRMGVTSASAGQRSREPKSSSVSQAGTLEAAPALLHDWRSYESNQRSPSQAVERWGNSPNAMTPHQDTPYGSR
jgi:hypothetical protein